MRQIVTSPTFVFTVFFIYIATALISVPLHYRVRRRLKAAGMPVRWSAFSNVIDTWRMYAIYRDEATARGWQLWPYYVHVALVGETVIFGLVVFAVIFVRT